MKSSFAVNVSYKSVMLNFQGSIESKDRALIKIFRRTISGALLADLSSLLRREFNFFELKLSGHLFKIKQCDLEKKI